MTLGTRTEYRVAQSFHAEEEPSRAERAIRANPH
jgi:hypothetical protein